jgi:membrane protease subunit HflK
MANDQQTYKRGVTAAMFGLGTQIALLLATIIVGMYANSPVFYAAAFHTFAGIFIWAVLLVLFNQHRLERAEALEVEQLAASDANMAALFDENAENLRVSRRRLERLYKWGLNVVSCVTGFYLLIFGAALFHQIYYVYINPIPDSNPEMVAGVLSYTPHLIRPNATLGLLLVFSLVLTLSSFIVARYEAGMTKIHEWQLLRGGAAFLVGNALIYALLSVALAAKLFGNDAIMLYVAQAVPAIMIILGGETLLVFMLNVYRPRRPGEVPRPAFDSRLLGMMTSPTSLAKAIGDALNYQFGFEVSQSWFFQLLTKWIGVLVGVCVLVLWAMSSLIIVEPHEQAIILSRSSTVQTGELLDPGLHVRAPWPFRSVVKRDVSRIREIVVTSSEDVILADQLVLWDNEVAEEGKTYRYFITRPAGSRATGDGASVEGAVAVFNAQVNIQWRVTDLREYLAGADRPEVLLQNLCESIVSEYFMRQDIDSVIGKGRAVMGAELRQRMQAAVDSAGEKGKSLGVRIIFVGLNAVRPPAEGSVARSFETEVTAIQEAQMAVDTARRDAIQTLARAAGTVERVDALVSAIGDVRTVSAELDELTRSGADADVIEAKREELRQAAFAADDAIVSSSQGKAAELLLVARAQAWQEFLSERGKATRFESQLAAFENAPDYYRMRSYLEVLTDGMGDARIRKVIVTAGDAATREMTLDLTDGNEISTQMFRPEGAGE